MGRLPGEINENAYRVAKMADEDGKFDAAGPIEAALVYATPFVILCKEDCKGLCPTCGADLNEGPCACDSSDDIDPDNPFAVLKNLKFNEE